MVLTAVDIKKFRTASVRLNLLLLAVSLFGLITAYLASQVFVSLQLSQFLPLIAVVFGWVVFSLIFDLTTRPALFWASHLLTAAALVFILFSLTTNLEMAILTSLVFSGFNALSFWQLRQYAQSQLKVDWLGLFRLKWNVFTWTVIISLALFVLLSAPAEFVSKERFMQIVSFSQPIFEQTNLGLTPSTTVGELVSRELSDQIKKLNGQLREAAISLTVKQLSDRLQTEINKEDTLSDTIFKYLNRVWKTASQDQVKLYALKLSSIVFLIIILQPVFWFWGWILSYVAILPLALLKRLGLYEFEPETVSRDKIVV